MKNIKILLILITTLFLLGSQKLYSQSTAAGNGFVAGRYLGFNATSGANPLYFRTNFIDRMKLNGSLAYTVNTLPGVRDGFFLLGPDGNVTGGTLYGASRGPFSLLHLNGNTNNPANVQEFGYRVWMRTGITFTDNGDRAYVGYRAGGIDVSDFVINWSDNSVGGFPGPDNLIFNFTAGTGVTSSDDIGGDHPNGREVARLTGYGYMGIGPRFDNTMVPPSATTKGQPQADLHINKNDNWAAWIQVSIQKFGQRNVDGLRMGVVGAIQNPANPLFLINTFAPTPSVVGTAMIYNQENRPLLFSTGEANTTNAFTGINSTRERVRIMAVGDSTQLNAGSGIYRVNNPGSLISRMTRMSISHDPTTPVTRPLSLLHLGYNTLITGVDSTNGWRNWMDIGMFVSQASDNVFIGLKREGGISVLNNRLDAVINWGDNPDTVGFLPVGPDNLRFIFTMPDTGLFASTVHPGSNADGLETGRFYPGRDTTFSDATISWGRFGVGDFSVNGVNEAPTHKLDVIGNGRFRYLPDSLYLADTLVDKVVLVDNDGVLRWKKGSFLGNYCGDSINTLTGDYEIDLADNELVIRRGGSVLIGDVFCGQSVQSRLFVRNTFALPALKPYGFLVETGNHPVTNIAGYFQTQPTGTFNIGVFGKCTPVNSPPITMNPPTAGNFAGYFDGDVYVGGKAYMNTTASVISDENLKTEIDSITNATEIMNQLKPRTFYYDTVNHAEMNFSTRKQYGFIAQDVEQVLPSLVESQLSIAKFDSTGTIINNPQMYKNLNYNSFIAILTRAFQEQSFEADSLKGVISVMNERLNVQDSINNALYSMISQCCQNISVPRKTNIVL